MNSRTSTFAWLDNLRQLMPASGVVLLGAGTGTGRWVQYLRDRNYPAVTLVEADDDQFQHLQRVTSPHREWRLAKQLVAPDEGPVVFHHASLPSESGLLKPELLRDLWPNLKTRNQQTLQPITLERLLHKEPTPANWLFVDCLPALPIIESAGLALDAISVIVARVLLNESSLGDGKAHLSALQTVLNGHHFRTLSVETSRHPGFGYVLLAKDSESIIQTIHSHLAESEHESARLKAVLTELELRVKSQNNEVKTVEGQLASLKNILLLDRNLTAIDSNDLTFQPSLQPSPHLKQIQIKWEEGDWDALCRVGQETVEPHPERARIALFVAAAHHQMNHAAETLHWSQQALNWGVDITSLSRTLIAGIYNTLARHAARQRDKDLALSLFTEAVTLPGIIEAPLGSDSRIVRELARIGLLSEGAEFVESRIHELNTITSLTPWMESQISILKTNMELLQSELVIAQRRGQLHANAHSYGEDTPVSLAHANTQWENELKNRATSQLGQDLWVLEKTSYKRGGFFIEFGATNGVLLSNTYLLEKEFGWTGICAEPNPHFFKQLQINRLCELSTACIGANTGEQVEFIFADVYGGMAKDAASDPHGMKRQAFRESGETATLTTVSLHDFLVSHNAPRTIDYLSIDTEGSEFSILETFPFMQWDIRLLTVEHNFSEQRAKIRDLLEGFGYRCHEANFDDWYYKE